MTGGVFERGMGEGMQSWNVTGALKSLSVHEREDSEQENYRRSMLRGSMSFENIKRHFVKGKAQKALNVNTCFGMRGVILRYGLSSTAHHSIYVYKCTSLYRGTCKILIDSGRRIKIQKNERI